jgi:hypothetical protein
MLSTVGGALGVGGIDVNSPRHGCAADQTANSRSSRRLADRSRERATSTERVLLGYDSA